MAELKIAPETEPMPMQEIQGANPSELPADLFPLPLTPFEHYLIIDDSPSHPMSIFVQLTFREPVNLERLDTALSLAIERHPLLASRLQPWKQTWAWVHDPTWRVTIHPFALHPPCVNGKIVPQDLCIEPGLRAWHDDQGAGARLIFQFHHACADGLGFRRFIIDLLACYARLGATHGDPILQPNRFDRLDPARLHSRGCLAHLETTNPIKKLTRWQRTNNLIYFFFQPPVSLGGSAKASLERESGEEEMHQEPTEILRLDEMESSAILERSRNDHVNVNDLALATLFHVSRRWNERHKCRGPRRRIRLLMPFDLRTKEDLRLSAANRMSFSFLGRTHRQCEDWETLLRSVQLETRAIKDSRVYVDFLQGLKSGMAHPALLRWILRRSQKLATLVFTYTGDVQRGLGHVYSEVDGCIRVGDTLLEDVLGAPPVRKNTNLAIGMCRGKGRICLSAAWNRQVLTREDTRQFLAMFANALRNWALFGKPEA